MTNTPDLGQRRTINWVNVNTVLSAAILIGAEVFGAAYAGGWAVENLTGLGSFIIGIVTSIVHLVGISTPPVSQRAGVLLLQIVFFCAGAVVMVAFIRQASRVEPFVSRQ